MKLLLDTHAFIWLSSNREKLSSKVIRLLENNKNELFLSVVSLWEMQIKAQLGKLKLQIELAEMWDTMSSLNDIQFLNIKLNHIWKLGQLENHHKDPFVISQATTERLTIISKDQYFSQYNVDVAW